MKFLFLMLFIASCANVPQIDRGQLSRKIMSLDPRPEENSFKNEIRAYREGAVGGSSSVGGGCGCN